MLNLDRFIMEVRPTGTVLDAETIRQPFDEDKCHVVLLGPQDVGVFAEVADKLAWGSAVVFVDLNEDAVTFVQSIADKMHFNEWIQAPYPGFVDGARSWVKTSGNNDHYATHLPILLKAVEETTGPVLELGAGDSSTAALHKLCAAQGRLLVTVDNSAEYIEKFTHLMTDDHKFEHLVDPAETVWLMPSNLRWGVVFVDHAPGETRGKAIERARDNADYIVVHDTETLGYGVEDLLASFKYRVDFRKSRPWTTVASMTKEIWK